MSKPGSPMTPHDYLRAQTRWHPLEYAFWLATLLPFVLFPNYLVAGEPDPRSRRLFALSLDLILGYAGIVSLGHAAFFGIGAYTAGIISKHGLGDPILGLVVAALLTGLVGFATSFIISRFKHLALIMITLGLGFLVHELANAARSLTGGADGLQGIQYRQAARLFRIRSLGRTAYYLFAGGAVLLFLAVRRLTNSPFGLALRGIRENSVAHAGDRRAKRRAYPQGLHDVRAPSPESPVRYWRRRPRRCRSACSTSSVPPTCW